MCCKTLRCTAKAQLSNPKLTVDPMRLRQILLKLLSNACKVTRSRPHSGSPWISSLSPVSSMVMPAPSAAWMVAMDFRVVGVPIAARHAHATEPHFGNAGTVSSQSNKPHLNLPGFSAHF